MSQKLESGRTKTVSHFESAFDNIYQKSSYLISMSAIFRKAIKNVIQIASIFSSMLVEHSMVFT